MTIETSKQACTWCPFFKKVGFWENAKGKITLSENILIAFRKKIGFWGSKWFVGNQATA